jgi:hypothetical protein
VDTTVPAAVAANKPPVVTLPGPNPITATAKAAAVLLDPTATVTDPDSPNFNGGLLRVQMLTNGAADDRLELQTDNIITVAQGRVRFSGELVGDLSGGDGLNPLVITFTAAQATPLVTQELLRHITFANVSDTPSTTARTVEVIVVDDLGAASTAVTRTVNVAKPIIPPKMEVAINLGATVTPTAPKVIGKDALTVTSPNGGPQGPPTITYTLTQAPEEGVLLFQQPGVPNFLPFALKVGQTFTQDDIDNNRLAYRLQPTSTANTDRFFFTAADGLGGTVVEALFSIRVNRGTSPTLVKNTGVKVALGVNATTVTITPSQLSFAAPVDAQDLQYNIVTSPKYGNLTANFFASFTQKNVNDNELTYTVPGARTSR